MNQRLVWNFEFTPKDNLTITSFEEIKEDSVKWEIRYFWPDNKPILLNAIDDRLFDITKYQQKYKEDHYYLLPENNYNIKKRRNQLLYKPLLKKTASAFGFGAKIVLNNFQDTSPTTECKEPHLLDIMEQVAKKSTEVSVKKETFSFKFPTKPKIKIGLERLETMGKIFFSVCIEGRSLYLVETIAEHLLEGQVSCEYVTFLKRLSNLC